MYRARVFTVARRLGALLLAAVAVLPARAEEPSMQELLERLRGVETEQKKLRQQLDEKDAEVGELKKEVERLKAEAAGAPPAASRAPAGATSSAARSGWRGCRPSSRRRTPS